MQLTYCFWETIKAVNKYDTQRRQTTHSFDEKCNKLINFWNGTYKYNSAIHTEIFPLK